MNWTFELFSLGWFDEYCWVSIFSIDINGYPGHLFYLQIGRVYYSSFRFDIFFLRPLVEKIVDRLNNKKNK